MSSALKRISVAEYLQLERQAQTKSEYFDGEIFAMAGGSPNHSLIAANITGEIRAALKARPCRVFNSDLRVKVDASGLYTYPDATIVCGEMEFDDDQRDTLTNPTVLVEVLYESTEKYDRGRKSQHYRQIPSLKELVLISQERQHVEWLSRDANGTWVLREQTELDRRLQLDSIGVEVSLAEIYRGVELPPETTEPFYLPESSDGRPSHAGGHPSHSDGHPSHPGGRPSHPEGHPSYPAGGPSEPLAS